MLARMTRFFVCGAIHLAVAAYLVCPARAESGLMSGLPTGKEACPPTTGSVPRQFVPVGVPGWRDRYPGMRVLIRPSAIRMPSPALRITSATALAGIEQAVVVRSRTLTVVVHGRTARGRPVIIVGWTQGTRTHESVQRLDLAD